jgi:hypothetical protein
MSMTGPSRVRPPEHSGGPTVSAASGRTAAVLPGGLALLLAAVVVAVGGQGAVGGPSRIVAAGLLAGACIATLTVTSTSDGASARAVRPTSAVRSEVGWIAWWLLAVGVWALVRGWVGGDVRQGLGHAALAAGIVAALIVAHRATATQREMVRTALMVCGAIAAVVGWAGVVWRVEPLALPSSGVWRAAGTLTYENALAGLLVPLALLALAHVTAAASASARIATSATMCLLLVGVGTTLSRGGALALAVGLAVLAWHTGLRALVRAVWGPVVGTAVALGGLLPSIAVTAQPRPLLAGAALAVGVAIAVRSSRARAGRGAALGAVVAAIVVLVVVAVLVPDAADVLRPRATVASPHRVAQHTAALAQLAQHPVVGVGPGRGAVSWSDTQGTTLVARYLHDEYLQVVLELGFIGAVLMAGAIASAARALRCGRCVALPVAWSGSVAALCALAAHSAVDFLWHVPVIPIVAPILTGAATRYPPSGRPDGAPMAERKE